VKFKRAWRRTADAVARSEGGSSPERQPPDGAERPKSPASENPGAGEVPDSSTFEQHHASTSPELAVQGASRQIAQRLNELLGDGKIGYNRQSDDLAALGVRAHTSGAIPADVLDSLQGLSALHDLAQTAPERVTPAQAQEFQVLTKAILYTLSDRRLGRSGPSNKVAAPACPRSDGRQ
jgi:hypothetical protein